MEFKKGQCISVEELKQKGYTINEELTKKYNEDHGYDKGHAIVVTDLEDYWHLLYAEGNDGLIYQGALAMISVNDVELVGTFHLTEKDMYQIEKLTSAEKTAFLKNLQQDPGKFIPASVSKEHLN